MTIFVSPTATIGQAWYDTLKKVWDAGGSAVHVLSTVTDPAGDDDSALRQVADHYLVERCIRKHHVQTVATVANTIFPAALYRSPGYAWSPAMKDTDKEEALNDAADSLYGRYISIKEQLAQFNRTGTYFQRMIAWNNHKNPAYNQIAARIRMLRSNNSSGIGRFNASDITVEGDAERFAVSGVQTYSSTDERIRGFPCLVHIDLSIVDKRLNLLAVYRHQYLVTKAYGNMVGLARLQRFLAEQSGYDVGELSIMASFADCESSIWTKKTISRILTDGSAGTTPLPGLEVAQK